MKTLGITIVLAGLLALSIYAAMEIWGALAGTTISIQGWIALGTGAVVTFGLGAGLMFLVFYSSRQGYDDPDDRRR